MNQPQPLVVQSMPLSRDLYHLPPFLGAGRLGGWVNGWLEKILGLAGINKLYQHVGPDRSWLQFARGALEYLNIGCQVPEEQLAKIPAAGPLIVVANHPFGAIEGLVLAQLLARRRDDVKIMANYLLGRIAPLRDLFVLVDPFGVSDSRRRNTTPLRQALRHLSAGGVLGIFPAGEVAHRRGGTVTDPPWTPMLARLIASARCAVTPMYFAGRNSALFQILGLVHPRLRTAMLAREVFNKRHQRLDLRIGAPIPFDRLKDMGDSQCCDYLRYRTYALGHAPAPALPRRDNRLPEPVIDAVPGHRLAAEVGNLPQSARLVETDEFTVYLSDAQSMPGVMREIGRLRELTFRATGEGTGKPLDLDRFDPYYLHLFVWNNKLHQVVGAYRLGLADQIIARHGVKGLYTRSLFQFSPKLIERIGPMLELGRSFVRAEYQRAYAPLMLLWKGIGRYVQLHPDYKCLLGPVSISHDYQTLSRQLMVRFLMEHHARADLAALVKANNPFALGRIKHLATSAGPRPSNSDELSALVAELESDEKGIPILLKQYLKLGAQILAASVDEQFSNVVDALLLVDMTKAEVRLLDRYMGQEGRKAFLKYHEKKNVEC